MITKFWLFCCKIFYRNKKRKIYLGHAHIVYNEALGEEHNAGEFNSSNLDEATIINEDVVDN